MHKIKLSIVFITLLSVATYSQMFMNPVSTALAGAYSTKARGASINGWNPANLGFANNPKFSMNFGILPLAFFPTFKVYNSGLSPYVLNNYFFTGSYLSDEDKNELLDFIPNEGLNIYPLVQFPLVNLSFGHWALLIGTEAMGTITLPKSLFNLVLFGNEFSTPVDLSDTNVDYQTVLSVSLAHGREVNIPVLSDVVEKTSVGAAIKFLGGLAYAGFDQFDAELTTYKDRIILDGNAKAAYGKGGFGMAFDIGMSTIINEKMAANVSLNNLFGKINWGIIDAQQVEYSFNSEIFSEDFAEIDSIFERESTDSIYTIDNLSTNYPGYMLVGFEYKVLENLDAYATIKQYFGNDLATSSIPKVSLATEFRAKEWLPLRLGFSFGGIESFQWGIGSGLSFQHYALNIGYLQTGGMFNKAKGFALSFGQSIIF